MLVALVGLGGCGPKAVPVEGPRVLLITVDTLRADCIGAYGGTVPTPAMDGLAAAGVTVSSASTPTPTTAPAHASLLTGLHPWRHGVVDNVMPLAEGTGTLATLAHGAGLATAAFVSSYILHPRFGFASGFDSYHFAPSEAARFRGRDHPGFWTRGAQTTDAALAWLDAHGDHPFFVWVHYFDPHDPYDPPPGFARPPGEPVPLEGKQLPRQLASFAQLADAIRGYRGDVAYTDAQVGRLVEGLRRLGLLDRTAIVLTADHGEGLGDHGLLGHGENLFEELLHVPLIVRAPGVPAGRRLEGTAQLEDVMPTVLELLAVPVPDGLDGRSLMPWLRGDAPRSPRELVVGRRKPYPQRPELYYERRGSSKWIGEPARGGAVFRLDADPRETRGEPAPTPPALAAALAVPGAAPRPAPVLDAESRRALEALGYLEETPRE
jgi:arylsulfatase A-like enzyme